MLKENSEVRFLNEILRQGEHPPQVADTIYRWALKNTRRVHLLALELVARTQAYKHLEQRLQELEREVQEVKGGKNA